MKATHRWHRPWLWLLLAVATAGLAACGSGSVRPPEVEVVPPQSFGLIIQAYNSGQFLVAGGVVSPAVLDEHLAYLQSRTQLPASVLLERSAESGIRGPHLQAFLHLQAKYGFKAYVVHDGTIEALHPDS